VLVVDVVDVDVVDVDVVDVNVIWFFLVKITLVAVITPAIRRIINNIVNICKGEQWNSFLRLNLVKFK